jgi:hypothetical protein
MIRVDVNRLLFKKRYELQFYCIAQELQVRDIGLFIQIIF